MANTFESPLEIRLVMSLGQLNPAQSEIHKSVTTSHPRGGQGGNSHLKRSGLLVVSLRGVKLRSLVSPLSKYLFIKVHLKK